MGRLRYSEKVVSGIVKASRGASASREKPSVWREALRMRDEWRRNRYSRLRA